MAKAVTILPSGGVAVTNTISPQGMPVTPVNTGGMGITLVSSGGLPMTLVDESLAAYDTSATALFGAMTTQPTTARMALINTLIAGLKTDDLWTRFDLFYVLAAHDSQAGRLNWKSPGTYTLSENGTGTWTTDRDWAGNGTDGWLGAGVAPSALTQFQQNSAVAFTWSRTVAQSAVPVFGIGTGTSFHVHPRNTSDQFAYRINQATTTTTANTDGSGLFAVSRTGASATQGYRNGAALGSAGSVASVAPSSTVVGISIGRNNSTYSSVACAAAGVGSALDATQQANLYTRLNTFMTAIGAA